MVIPASFVAITVLSFFFKFIFKSDRMALNAKEPNRVLALKDFTELLFQCLSFFQILLFYNRKVSLINSRNKTCCVHGYIFIQMKIHATTPFPRLRKILQNEIKISWLPFLKPYLFYLLFETCPVELGFMYHYGHFI